VNPTPNPTDVFSGLAAAGLIGFIVALLLGIAWAIFCLWVIYTIIWRAVRRGLYEYHNPRHTRASRDLENRVRGPRDW